jgi:DNA-directed RNA polymerase I subunit RPA43
VVGKVNLCSLDHVSPLVQNVFNASIPRHHVPSQHWECGYRPAENNLEGVVEGPTTKENSKDANVKMVGETEQTPREPDHLEASMPSGGRWVHHLIGDMIGGNLVMPSLPSLGRFLLESVGLCPPLTEPIKA